MTKIERSQYKIGEIVQELFFMYGNYTTVAEVTGLTRDQVFYYVRKWSATKVIGNSVLTGF